jgi:NAD(P)-dependent dehydrogenase (short-subunit alcohol dehydrogenase family)
VRVRILTPLADLLTRSQQFSARPFCESFGPHGCEQLICGTELLAGVDSPTFAAKPFAIHQVRARMLSPERRAAAVVHAVRGRITATPVAELALNEFDALLRTNIRATFIFNRMAARQVRDGGAIINLSRAVVTSPWPAYDAYATTTAATDALTRVLALELRDRDITVNGVSLEADNRRPPGRVADIVAYLLSDAGHGITGQVIHLADRHQVK